jgi:hypothetical protein
LPFPAVNIILKGMKKPRKRTTIKEDTGKLLMDLGKLVFGSIFLGGILRGEIPHAILSIGGFAVAITFCLLGLFIGTREEKNGENGHTPLKQG